jgi:putative serine protease PepD
MPDGGHWWEHTTEAVTRPYPAGSSGAEWAPTGAGWPPEDQISGGWPDGNRRVAGPARRRPGWLPVAAVAAAVAAAVGAGVGAGIAEAVGGSGQTVIEQFRPNTSNINTRPTDVQGILARVLPAVVTIMASAVAPATPFGGIFGGGSGQQVVDEGTGMIITSGGQVVTNNHVIAGATSVTVTLQGSAKRYPARVVGADPADDVALLQIRQPPANLPTVTFGRSGAIQVGDDVVAIGNALGLAGGPTVTAGIISAEGRTVTAGDQGTGSTETLTDMLQTDAAINPGNSGGPLVDSQAQVIGMNTATAGTTSNGTSAQNIGFAIPSAKIQALLGLLRRGGTVPVSRAFIGVQVFTLTPSLRSEYNLTPKQGAVIAQVVPGSPADRAGLQAGDVIVRLGGRTIRTAVDLTNAVRSHHPGERVVIGIWRGNQRLDISVRLGQTPSA